MTPTCSPPRAPFRDRLAAYTALLRPGLDPAVVKAFTQCGFIYDTLSAFLPYMTTDGDRAVVNSCIQAVSPTNPKIKEYFIA